MLKTAFYFIQSAMTRFTARIFPYQSRVSLKEAFEGLEPDEGKLSRPVLRGLGSRKAAWLLGSRWCSFPHDGGFLHRRASWPQVSIEKVIFDVE